VSKRALANFNCRVSVAVAIPNSGPAAASCSALPASCWAVTALAEVPASSKAGSAVVVVEGPASSRAVSASVAVPVSSLAVSASVEGPASCLAVLASAEVPASCLAVLASAEGPAWCLAVLASAEGPAWCLGVLASVGVPAWCLAVPVWYPVVQALYRAALASFRDSSAWVAEPAWCLAVPAWYPVVPAVYPVGPAVQASVAARVADRFQGGYSVPRRDGSTEEDGAGADGSLVGDSSTYRHIPALRCTGSDADGTSNSADDTELAILPKRCDCNRPGATTSSIPNHPSPTAGCSPQGC
jgi:hypothetical protein